MLPTHVHCNSWSLATTTAVVAHDIDGAHGQDPAAPRLHLQSTRRLASSLSMGSPIRWCASINMVRGIAYCVSIQSTADSQVPADKCLDGLDRPQHGELVRRCARPARPPRPLRHQGSGAAVQRHLGLRGARTAGVPARRRTFAVQDGSAPPPYRSRFSPERTTAAALFHVVLDFLRHNRYNAEQRHALGC